MIIIITDKKKKKLSTQLGHGRRSGRLRRHAARLCVARQPQERQVPPAAGCPDVRFFSAISDTFLSLFDAFLTRFRHFFDTSRRFFDTLRRFFLPAFRAFLWGIFEGALCFIFEGRD
jgi:hypothetical protein